MTYITKLLHMALLTLFVAGPTIAHAQVVEPKKVVLPEQLKPGEGALRLSVRTQKQFTDTFFLYFVRLDDSGKDSMAQFRFERKAGVPIAGSNMIDIKPIIYRMPAGKYRLLAYTMKCEGVPAVGAICRSSFGTTYPTGHYRPASPTFEVKDGGFTDGGDFILEYSGRCRSPKWMGMKKSTEMPRIFAGGRSWLQDRPRSLGCPMAARRRYPIISGPESPAKHGRKASRFTFRFNAEPDLCPEPLTKPWD